MENIWCRRYLILTIIWMFEIFDVVMFKIFEHSTFFQIIQPFPPKICTFLYHFRFTIYWQVHAPKICVVWSLLIFSGVYPKCRISGFLTKIFKKCLVSPKIFFEGTPTYCEISRYFETRKKFWRYHNFFPTVLKIFVNFGNWGVGLLRSVNRSIGSL